MINNLKVSWENFRHLLLIRNVSKTVHKLISNAVLSFKGDAVKFYPTFYKCILDAGNPFGGSLNKHVLLLLGFELANPILGYLSGGYLEKDSVGKFKYSSADLREKKSIFFYLAGFIFCPFSRRLRFSKKTKKIQNSPEILEEYLHILAAGKLGDNKQELPEHKLMNTKNRVGLWKVTAEVFEIFCPAKHMVKKHTETCSNQTDGQLITKAVLEDTSVLANFSKLKSRINHADNEITKNILEDFIHLYIKIRTFTLVRIKWTLTNYCFGQSNPCHLKKESKNHVIPQQAPPTCDTPASSSNLLRRIL